MDLDNTLWRPAEILFNKVNAAKAFAKLGWKAKSTMPNVVRRMLEAELESAPSPAY